MTDPLLIRQLQSIDWDFPEKLPGTTTNHHWYPGTFPSQLPATFVEALSDADGLVFDPYGGIGTTSTEALRLGRKAWYVENNPVAALAAYTKAALIILESVERGSGQRLLGMLESVVSNADAQSTEELELELRSELFYQADSLLDKLIRPKPAEFLVNIINDSPRWDLMIKWYHPKTLDKLKRIFDSIDAVDGASFATIVLITMLSACLKPGSSQTKSWGHIADNVLPKSNEFVDKDVYMQSVRWLRKLKRILSNSDISSLNKLNSIRAWFAVHDWNAEEKPSVNPTKAPKLLVTSPPYGDAIDYILGQRLSLYLIGYSDQQITNLCDKEIGARRKRFKRGSKERWAEELVSALHKQVSFLSSKGFAAFVMPHKDAGRENGSGALEECMIEGGWEKLFQVDRSIRQLRTRQRWTSIKRETIQIYKN